MNNSDAVMSVDIVGHAAKTEELKAELLNGISGVFRDTAMGSRILPSERDFARSLNILLMLANRCGIDQAVLADEMRSQAKAGIVRGDDYTRDHKAVLAFIGKDNRRQR